MATHFAVLPEHHCDPAGTLTSASTTQSAFGTTHCDTGMSEIGHSAKLHDWEDINESNKQTAQPTD